MSTIAKPAPAESGVLTRKILGLQFFTGDVAQAVDRMNSGGLLVVPAAPALKDLPRKKEYREALLNADLAIPDSGFMVMLWNLIERDNVPKVSGLAYLRHLLAQENIRIPGNTFWIMANAKSKATNVSWLQSVGIPVSEEDVYLAPFYGEPLEDRKLLRILNEARPQHIVVTIGGGNQERLGLYLKRNLDFQPAIHCIGAAIAFLSGDQVRIPHWADKLFLGWLFRCVSQPSLYVSRYWEARKLFPLMLRYRDKLPPSEV